MTENACSPEPGGGSELKLMMNVNSAGVEADDVPETPDYIAF